MIKYALIEERFESEETGEYISYGIEASDGTKVSDISLERDEVKRLAELCSKLELDPIHLKDVAEDFLEQEVVGFKG